MKSSNDIVFDFIVPSEDKLMFSVLSVPLTETLSPELIGYRSPLIGSLVHRSSPVPPPCPGWISLLLNHFLPSQVYLAPFVATNS